MMSIILVVRPGERVPAPRQSRPFALGICARLDVHGVMAKKKSSDTDPKVRKPHASSSEEPSTADAQVESADDLSFEAALQDLERVVASLEGGDLTLQESLEAYERGIARLRVCHQRLTAAERRIALLTGFDANGNPMLSPFVDCDEGDLQQKQQSRAQRRGVQHRADPPIDDSGALF